MSQNNKGVEFRVFFANFAALFHFLDEQAAEFNRKSDSDIKFPINVLHFYVITGRDSIY